MHRHRISRARLSLLGGLFLGALAGLSLVAVLGTATASQAPGALAAPRLEVAHLSPALRAANEKLELEYDAYCLAGPEADPEAPCTVSGTVHVRTGERGPFRAIPLTQRAGAGASGALAATVPEALTRSPQGVAYFAELHDEQTGATTTIPAGGASAPHRSWALGSPVTVDLGAHRFGGTRLASERVVSARWGDGASEVGLEEGRNLSPIGASAFDVLSDRSVVVLDEAKRRALRFVPGKGSPTAIPLDIEGTIADLAVSGDGVLHVLETTTRSARSPVLRVFSSTGRALGETPLAERAYRVRVTPDGAAHVRTERSSQWMQARSRHGVVLPETQRATARSGAAAPDGSEVHVLRRGNEVRLALVRAGAVQRSWRLISDTPLAEVQVAEPAASRLVVVVRAYTDANDEFLVLVLGPKGVSSRFAVGSFDWAETAPLSRFRLVGDSLYQLGSTRAGVFVDRFDLEVK